MELKNSHHESTQRGKRNHCPAQDILKILELGKKQIATDKMLLVVEFMKYARQSIN